jgi:N-acetylglutamate synthase-like GNAT family acetyltransferase
MSDEIVVIREASAPGDLGWMIMTHGETYAREYGWDTTFEALVARILADYANTEDRDRARAWIAEVDGRRAGCVMCCAAAETTAETTAELHTLLVEPWARGHRLGTRLVDQCLEFARKAGYARMRLWTNEPLAAARHIYLSRGFALVSQEPHHSFGHDMVGQHYELDLR